MFQSEQKFASYLQSGSFSEQMESISEEAKQIALSWADRFSSQNLSYTRLDSEIGLIQDNTIRTELNRLYLKLIVNAKQL